MLYVDVRWDTMRVYAGAPTQQSAVSQILSQYRQLPGRCTWLPFVQTHGARGTCYTDAAANLYLLRNRKHPHVTHPLSVLHESLAR